MAALDAKAIATTLQEQAAEVEKLCADNAELSRENELLRAVVARRPGVQAPPVSGPAAPDPPGGDAAESGSPASGPSFYPDVTEYDAERLTDTLAAKGWRLVCGEWDPSRWKQRISPFSAMRLEGGASVHGSTPERLLQFIDAHERELANRGPAGDRPRVRTGLQGTSGRF
jgi:hypothetical protein